jgi:hypothetical protein
MVCLKERLVKPVRWRWSTTSRGGEEGRFSVKDVLAPVSFILATQRALPVYEPYDEVPAQSQHPVYRMRSPTGSKLTSAYADFHPFATRDQLGDRNPNCRGNRTCIRSSESPP